MKKKKSSNNEKITVGYFFSVHLRIIKELFSMYKVATTAIILLSLATIFEQIIELKFLEYITNDVYYYFTDGTRNFKSVLLYCGCFVGMLLIMKITSNTYYVLVEKYNSKVMFQSEKKIIKKLSSISYEHYEKNDFYENVNMAKRASGQYSQAVYGIKQITDIIFMMIMYGIMLSKINFLYIILIFASIIVSVFLSTKTTDKQLDYWRANVSPNERRCWYFRDVFKDRINHQNIQTSRAYPYFGEKYACYNNYLRKDYIKLNLYSFSTELFSSLMFLVTYFFAAIIVGKGIALGEYEIGYYSMIIALLANLFNAIKRFVRFMLNGSQYVKVMDAYYDILNTPDRNERHFGSTNAMIEMKNVKYQYAQAERYALNNIDCSFNGAMKIALVGENGSGKSTLVSIILNLLENFEGEYSQKDINKTAILQDFIQYQMSVKENIEIGCGGKALSEEKICEILKKVDLYDFVMEKPDGIYTKLGQLENGVELSKGQWQRLAIARMLADESARVWILDEPTAYLDPISEIEMNDFILSLAEDRLVFFISHRLGFAKKADIVVVLNDGVIAETGTHTELLQKEDGIYARMYRIQSEWYK